jgi:DNA-binding CsgD family transcriptional regulator
MSAEPGGDERTGDGLLVDSVRASALPIGLVDLADLSFLAVSPSASELLDVDPDHPGDVLPVTAEPDATREAIDVMQRGVIEAYEARRKLLVHDHDVQRATLWVRSLASCGYPDRALVLIASAGDDDKARELPRLDPSAPEVVAGSADEGGRIDRVSPEIEALLGTGSLFRANRLPASVHPEDHGRVAQALALTVADRTPVGVSVHLQRADGAWTPVRLVVAAHAGQEPPRLGFAITDRVDDSLADDAPPDGSRAEQLERTLHRISNEIQALGLAPSMATLPTDDEVPELADLSARQWEIVTRLRRGERVPGIARSMFLSQSTIRNHLSAVFRKFGVHSQSELIEKLRARSGSLPTER